MTKVVTFDSYKPSSSATNGHVGDPHSRWNIQSSDSHRCTPAGSQERILETERKVSEVIHTKCCLAVPLMTHGEQGALRKSFGGRVGNIIRRPCERVPVDSLVAQSQISGTLNGELHVEDVSLVKSSGPHGP